MGDKIQIGEPSAPFRPYIKYYKYIESGLTGLFKVIPNTYIELYFHFTHIDIFSPGRYSLYNPLIHVSGIHQYEQPIYSHMHGTDRNGGFAIVFQPQVFFNLFNIKSSDLFKFTVDGNIVFGREIYSLWEELQAFNDIKDMIQLAETYLLVYAKRAPSRLDRINYIISYMDNSHGFASVSQICKLFNITQRSLDRNFIDEIGISPKELLNIFRINYAIKLISKNPDIDLTQISYLSGYYDQSHFIKEIRKVAGLPPSGLKRGRSGEASTQHNLLFVKAD